MVAKWDVRDAISGEHPNFTAHCVKVIERGERFLIFTDDERGFRIMGELIIRDGELLASYFPPK